MFRSYDNYIVKAKLKWYKYRPLKRLNIFCLFIVEGICHLRHIKFKVGSYQSVNRYL